MYFITMPLLSQRTRPDREDVSFPIPVFIPVYWTRDRTSRAMSGEGASFPYLVFNPPYWTRDRTSRAMSGEGASSPPHDIQKRLQHLGRVVVSPGGVVISPRRGRSSYPRRDGLRLPRKGCLSECTLSHKKSLLTTHQTGPSLT